MPRIHCPLPLSCGARVVLPLVAARHVQVLRLQPGNALTLFNGQGGEWTATVAHMGRKDVVVNVGTHTPIERETERTMHLVVGMPANERMDWLVEKATELGVASIWPVAMERSVLKLSGERLLRRQEHWQAIAVAACEQSGRNRVPTVHAPQPWPRWLFQQPYAQGISQAQNHLRLLLSLRESAIPLRQAAGDAKNLWLLHGPEGGLTVREENAALGQGWVAANLGARVLRAETAPVAALAMLA